MLRVLLLAACLGIFLGQAPAVSAQSTGQAETGPLAAPASLPPGTTVLPATLVNTFLTNSWADPAPDPSGIDFWPATGQLVITDSEIEEPVNGNPPAYWHGFNVFFSTPGGTQTGGCTTYTSNPTSLLWNDFSDEPAGFAINTDNGHFLFSSDGPASKVYDIGFGPDDEYCTSDDTVRLVLASPVWGTSDSEDVAYGDNTLFISDGTNAEVYSIPLGADGMPGGGDDGPVTHWDTAALGFHDLEGIAYNPDAGTLFIVSTQGTENYLGETSVDGTLLRAFDLSFMGTQGNIRSDVAYGPSSANPGVKSIYIASRGIDNNGNRLENDGKIWEIDLGTQIDVSIGGSLQESFFVRKSQQQGVSFAGLNNGPVEVKSQAGVPILASGRVAYTPDGGSTWTSFSELMGMPANQLTSSYVMPWYNNVEINSQLRFGNPGTTVTTVTVRIAGVVQGNYLMAPGTSLRVAYPGVNSGPVQVSSSGGVPIVASMRVAYTPDGGVTWTSFSEMMGMPTSRLTTSYVLPWYNNVEINSQLRFGNVGMASTVVTVKIGGVEYGSYLLAPSQSVRVAYAGANWGPVQITSSGGVPIIVSERVAYNDGSAWTGFSEMMGMPSNQLTTAYWVPVYDNLTVNGQLRFGNVGTAPTTVTVEIGGVVRGVYALAPSQAQRVSFAGLIAGPVKIEASGGVPIIASERVAYTPDSGATWTSYSEIMGLPANQLSTSYIVPWYNNVEINTQLRLAVP